MSYNGSGTFQINTSGQPVVAGTVISSTAFNALTADLATGLSTAITKDGQTTTTARIPFAAGINSSLTTDSTSTSTGSIITSGGVGIAKNLYVGVNANVAGTLGVTGVATFSATPIYSSLTASSAVATDASKALVSVTNTGTGNNVLATSPTLVTPILGTPQSGTLTNATGLPLTTGVTGILPEANGGTGTTVGYNGFKNRIINSAMVIDQRNAGASVTVNGAGTFYLIDRFQAQGQNADGVFTVQQSTTAPSGFTNSLLATVTTDDSSIGSTQYYFITQKIEGFNCADLGFGAAGASTVTLSFWVRSSVTGTFGGSLSNDGVTRSYPFTYAISSANTWEQKSVTIAGDTTGTWLTNNGIGIRVYFNIGAGSSYTATAGAWASQWAFNATGATNLIATNGATFYITGVQLEKGSTATSFDYRPYGTELALCQRYYYKVVGTSSYPTFGAGQAITTTQGRIAVQYPVQMRATPTVSFGGTVLLTASNGNGITVTSISVNYGNETGGMLEVIVASGITAGNATLFIAQNGSILNFIQALAEL
jgi:hypothetical protein